jgi:hypothetical protein
MLAIDTQVWVPIATTVIGGVIATGSVMLALVMSKSREIDQDYRRWIRQIRLDAYVSFLREDEALYKREGEVLNLVLAEAPEPEIEEAKERLHKEEKRMSVASDGLGAARAGLVVQPGQATLGVALSPQDDGRVRAPDLPGDLGV